MSLQAIFCMIKGNGFFISSRNNARPKHYLSPLKMSVIPPTESSNVGVIGRCFISILCAKLAAIAGYKSWLLVPPGQEEVITSLINDDSLTLDLIPSIDSDVVDSKLSETDTFLEAVDDDSTVDEDVINYILNPDASRNVKGVVVAMSRNLKASKLTANAETNSKADDYKSFEEVLSNDKVLLLLEQMAKTLYFHNIYQQNFMN